MSRGPMIGHMRVSIGTRGFGQPWIWHRRVCAPHAPLRGWIGAVLWMGGGAVLWVGERCVQSTHPTACYMRSTAPGPRR